MIKSLFILIGAVLGMVAVYALQGYITQVLWNSILVNQGLKSISLLEGLGLGILRNMIFGKSILHYTLKHKKGI